MARSRSARSRGTRAGLRRGSPKIARSRGSGRTIALSAKTGGIGRFGTRAPYGPGTPSVKRKDVYRALRRQGASKSKAARIANATANGTIDRKRRRGGGWRGARGKG